MPKPWMARDAFELPHGWWHDAAYRGGVEKRVGWWMEIPFDKLCHFYVVLFRDGTRSPVITGTNPLKKKEKK